MLKQSKKTWKARKWRSIGDVKLDGSEKERGKSGTKSVNVCC